jgi:hypothetical protein
MAKKYVDYKGIDLPQMYYSWAEELEGRNYDYNEAMDAVIHAGSMSGALNYLMFHPRRKSLAYKLGLKKIVVYPRREVQPIQPIEEEVKEPVSSKNSKLKRRHTVAPTVKGKSAPVAEVKEPVKVTTTTFSEDDFFVRTHSAKKQAEVDDIPSPPPMHFEIDAIPSPPPIHAEVEVIPPPPAMPQTKRKSLEEMSSDLAALAAQKVRASKNIVRVDSEGDIIPPPPAMTAMIPVKVEARRSSIPKAVAVPPQVKDSKMKISTVDDEIPPPPPALPPMQIELKFEEESIPSPPPIMSPVNIPSPPPAVPEEFKVTIADEIIPRSPLLSPELPTPPASVDVVSQFEDDEIPPPPQAEIAPEVGVKRVVAEKPSVFTRRALVPVRITKKVEEVEEVPKKKFNNTLTKLQSQNAFAARRATLQDAPKKEVKLDARLDRAGSAVLKNTVQKAASHQ